MLHPDAPRTAILLDDDNLIRMTWQLAARVYGVELAIFSTPGELEEHLPSIPKDTPIYVDVSLAGGIRGDDIARDLAGNGFSTIYLTTGYEPSQIPAVKGVRAVLGKDPPWM